MSRPRRRARFAFRQPRRERVPFGRPVRVACVRQIQRFFLWRRRIWADELEKVRPFDQLHREEPLVPLRKKLMKPHQAVMSQVRQRPEFVLEAVQRRGIQPENRLERHPASRARGRMPRTPPPCRRRPGAAGSRTVLCP